MTGSLLVEWSDVSTTLVFPTITSGSDRKALLVVAKTSGASTATIISGVTVGGVAATYEGGFPQAPYNRVAIGVWSLNEAQIAAMSGSAIVMSGGSGPTTMIAAAVIEGVQQSTSGSAAMFAHDDNTVKTGALSLQRTASSYTVYGVAVNITTTLTTSNPLTQTQIARSGSSLAVGSGTDIDITSDASYSTAGGTSRSAQVAVNFAPAGAYINPTGTDTTLTVGATHSIKFAGITSNPVSVAIVRDGVVAEQADFVLGAVTDGAATGTFTATIGNLPYGTSGYSYLVTCADDSEITFDIDSLSPASGRNYVVAVDPVSDETGILYVWDEGGPVTGDQIGWPVLVDGVTTTIRPDFTFYGETETTFPDSITLDVDYWDSVTSTRYYRSVEVAFGEDGEGTVIGITSRGFTAEGFTVRGFTARGF